jgi:hypothetical protein
MIPEYQCGDYWYSDENGLGKLISEAIFCILGKLRTDMAFLK